MNSSNRNKLGLALSGGGFRASLFHVGVLRRMAELDLLRYVEVLSTVSGGSIVGALYVLLLKRDLEKAPAGVLDRCDYTRIIDDLQEMLEKGIRKNLRVYLFLNPLGILRVLLTEHSLGRRMARLYERYLYREVVDALQPKVGRHLGPGQIALSDIRIYPRAATGAPDIRTNIEAYNREMVDRKDGKGSAITKLIVNATALNSGGRFWFSSTEIGDWYLGHFREDELDELLARKELMQRLSRSDLDRLLAAPAKELELRGAHFSRRQISLVRWLRDRRNIPTCAPPEGWEPLFTVDQSPDALREASFGLLRRAKLAAWYIRVGPKEKPPVLGDLGTPEEYMGRFWGALEEMDEDLAKTLRPKSDASLPFRDLLLDFVMELYLFRIGKVAHPRIKRHWGRLTLGEAVGASACFPPVFPPLVMLGFYDDLYVERLGLTDGGVFDNVGITALEDEDCNFIIASDTSGLFEVQERVSTGRIGMSGRTISIATTALARFQRHGLRERRRVSRAIQNEAPSRTLREFHCSRENKGLAYFHINSRRIPGPGLDSEIDQRLLARVRTDLDGFGGIERAALINHGYDTADRYIRKYLGGSVFETKAQAHWKPPAHFPAAMYVSRAWTQRVVAIGHARFFRALRFWPPRFAALPSWLFVIALAGLLGTFVWDLPVSFRAIIQAISDWLVALVDGSLRWLLPKGWTEWTISLGSLLVLLIGVVVAGILIRRALRHLVGDELQPTLLAVARRLASAKKMTRAYRWNLLWLVGGLPVVMAIVSSIVAASSYMFFYLPFRALTRNRPSARIELPSATRSAPE